MTNNLLFNRIFFYFSKAYPGKMENSSRLLHKGNSKVEEEQKSGFGFEPRKSYFYFQQMSFLETLRKTTDDSLCDGDHKLTRSI